MYKVLHVENIYTNVQNFKEFNSSLFHTLKTQRAQQNIQSLFLGM